MVEIAISPPGSFFSSPNLGREGNRVQGIHNTIFSEYDPRLYSKPLPDKIK